MSSTYEQVLKATANMGNTTVGMPEFACLICGMVAMLFLLLFHARYSCRVRFLILSAFLCCIVFALAHYDWTVHMHPHFHHIKDNPQVELKENMTTLFTAALFSLLTLFVCHTHISASRRGFTRSLEESMDENGRWRTTFFSRAVLFAPKNWELSLIHKLEWLVIGMLALELLSALLCCLA